MKNLTQSKKTEINYLVVDLENQLNINLAELSKYQENAKLPLHIINKKRKFLTDIFRLISETRFLLLHANKPQLLGYSNIDDFYLSDTMRHSIDNREKEGARQYSISKSKANNPELY